MDKKGAILQLQGQNNGQANFANGWQHKFYNFGGRTDTDGESPKVDYIVTEPEGWKLHGGEGEARICESPGKKRMFHDGCGLASPGCWDLEKRRWNKDSFWNNLRKDSMEAVLEHCGGQTHLDRMCFEMAAKGEAGCTLMKDEVLKQKLVDIWCKSLVEHGYKGEGLADIASGQPFRLKLMEALLDRAGDPDHKFLLQGEQGFPVGVLKALPRTPHMYEEQTSWKLEDDPYMKDEVWRSNYESVGEHEEFSTLQRSAEKDLWKDFQCSRPRNVLVTR